LQDYGGPVGLRLAVARPERVQAFIIQNAVSHEDGLGPLWQKRREFWANRAANDAGLRANSCLSPQPNNVTLGQIQTLIRLIPIAGWTNSLS
jgi:pimeloyl-ACP methyl ester carboxylesterase